VVVFSAHGVAPSVHEEAAARSLRTIDATCPLVTKVHAEARRFDREDYDILLIGHAGHEEVIGTMGEAPDRIHLVDGPHDVANVTVRDPERVVWLSQTTLSVDETLATVDQLRDFYELCRRSTHISRETARVAVLDGLDVLYLGRYDGTQPLRLTANIGDRFPASCTATGKAILSTLDPAVAEDRLRGRTLPALSERSITSVPALLADLAVARERGYAVDDEETTAGILCLSVPVKGFRTDSAPFAISVTVLKARLDDEFREALLKDLRAIAAGMENPMLPEGAATGTG